MTIHQNKPGRVTVPQINELMYDWDMMDADWPVCSCCKKRLNHMDLMDHRFPYEQERNLCQDCEEVWGPTGPPKAAAAVVDPPPPPPGPTELPTKDWKAKRPEDPPTPGGGKPNAPTTGPFPRTPDKIT